MYLLPLHFAQKCNNNMRTLSSIYSIDISCNCHKYIDNELDFLQLHCDPLKIFKICMEIRILSHFNICDITS